MNINPMIIARIKDVQNYKRGGSTFGNNIAKNGVVINPMSAMNSKMMSNQKAGDLKRSISFYAKKINKY
jgi:hypothetical protein